MNRMHTTFLGMTPVLPSQNIERDVAWYQRFVGFELIQKDDQYAVLKREHLFIHLQWHAGTDHDPLYGGSVIKIFVKNIHPIFKEMLEKEVVKPDSIRTNTPWLTNEFGFFDLNKNAVFFEEDI